MGSIVVHNAVNPEAAAQWSTASGNEVVASYGTASATETAANLIVISTPAKWIRGVQVTVRRGTAQICRPWSHLYVIENYGTGGVVAVSNAAAFAMDVGDVYNVVGVEKP